MMTAMMKVMELLHHEHNDNNKHALAGCFVVVIPRSHTQPRRKPAILRISDRTQQQQQQQRKNTI
jgi:hypothetical protein